MWLSCVKRLWISALTSASTIFLFCIAWNVSFPGLLSYPCDHSFPSLPPSSCSMSMPQPLLMALVDLVLSTISSLIQYSEGRLKPCEWENSRRDREKIKKIKARDQQTLGLWKIPLIIPCRYVAYFVYIHLPYPLLSKSLSLSCPLIRVACLNELGWVGVMLATRTQETN